MTYRYYTKVSALLSSPALADRRIVHVTGQNPLTRANAAALVVIFSVLGLNRTPAEACRPFDSITPPLEGFRDASNLRSTYDLGVRDVADGIHQAMLLGFVDFSDFDLREYEFYERVENGDFNWMVPGKFLALAGPHNVRHVDRGYPHLCPEDYFAYFRSTGVTDVVRLNKRLYEREKFLRAGFEHHDLFFTDGSTPPRRILTRFLEVCEQAKGALAVHCKAGLGRTGTLMGCYMMKHYRMTAAEVIAWLRIARPGSVIGPQQHYLESMQAEMWEDGKALGVRRRTEADRPAWAMTSLDESARSGRALPATPTRAGSPKPFDVSTPATTATSTARSRIVGRALQMPPTPPATPSDAELAGSKISLGASLDSDEGSEVNPSQGDLLTQAKARAQHAHQTATVSTPPLLRGAVRHARVGTKADGAAVTHVAASAVTHVVPAAAVRT
jgi:cell division cycle 14